MSKDGEHRAGDRACWLLESCVTMHHETRKEGGTRPVIEKNKSGLSPSFSIHHRAVSDTDGPRMPLASRRCDTPLRVPRKIPQLLKRSCRGSRREASLPRGRCGRVTGRGDRSDLPVGRRSDGYPLLPRGAAKTDAQLHRAPSSSPHGEPLPRKVC